MKKLNHKEEQVMQVLWQLGKGFVKEILDELPAPKPPITTVSSIVRKLEAEGLIGHEAFGKTHRYFPVLKKEDYRKSSFRQFINNYFGGSPEQLLSYFVKEEDLAPEELDRLLEKIKEQQKDSK